MRRTDDVFFFTLIDFLLQVFFFGLVLYVVTKAVQPAALSEGEETARKELLEKTGVSSLVELTDVLTRMGPLDQLPGNSEYFQKHGGFKGVKAAVEEVEEAGGPGFVRGLRTQFITLTKEAEGLKTEVKKAWGAPSCIYESVNGQTRPKNIAQVRVYDDRVELSAPTPIMEELLKDLGLEFSDVRSLAHAEFRKTFAPLAAKKKDCRYFLEILAQPQLYSSMKVVWSAFRTQ